MSGDFPIVDPASGLPFVDPDAGLPFVGGDCPLWELLACADSSPTGIGLPDANNPDNAMTGDVILNSDDGICYKVGCRKCGLTPTSGAATKQTGCDSAACNPRPCDCDLSNPITPAILSAAFSGNWTGPSGSGLTGVTITLACTATLSGSCHHCDPFCTGGDGSQPAAWCSAAAVPLNAGTWSGTRLGSPLHGSVRMLHGYVELLYIGPYHCGENTPPCVFWEYFDFILRDETLGSPTFGFGVGFFKIEKTIPSSLGTEVDSGVTLVRS